MPPKMRNPVLWDWPTEDEMRATYYVVGEFITSTSRLDSALSSIVASMTSLDDNPFAEFVTHHIITGQKFYILEQ